MNQSQLQPVVFGGLFIGVLSALPIVSLGNCACCLWVVGGGMLTAYLLQRDRAEPLALGEGAVNGLLAGVAGSVVYVVVAIPVGIVTAPFQRRMMEFTMEFMASSGGDLPPEVREMLEGFGTGDMIAGVAINFVLYLIAGVIFATLGGLFGALIFRPSTPQTPPAPPYVPPTPPSAPPAPPPPPAPQDQRS